MRLFVGTSGYSYKEWKGSFYPDDLPAAAMLPFYSKRFGTVEINNTFYRMPTTKLLEQWAVQTPEDFTFAIKAPQRITHRKRLADAADDITHFCEVSSVLGNRLGPLLFQLPPYAKKETARLHELFDAVKGDVRCALEFRHASWDAEDVTSELRAADAALCVADTDEKPFADGQTFSTASWGYLRLRRAEYTRRDLERWAERIAASGWSDAFVFFKHEDEGKGPRFAAEFLDVVGAKTREPFV